MQAVPEPSFNTVLQFGATILLSVTGFFLKGVASDLKEIKRQQERDGNRITALEAVTTFSHLHHPMRRADDPPLPLFRRSGPHQEES